MGEKSCRHYPGEGAPVEGVAREKERERESMEKKKKKKSENTHTEDCTRKPFPKTTDRSLRRGLQYHQFL